MHRRVLAVAARLVKTYIRHAGSIWAGRRVADDTRRYGPLDIFSRAHRGRAPIASPAPASTFM